MMNEDARIPEPIADTLAHKRSYPHIYTELLERQTIPAHSQRHCGLRLYRPHRYIHKDTLDDCTHFEVLFKLEKMHSWDDKQMRRAEIVYWAAQCTASIARHYGLGIVGPCTQGRAATMVPQKSPYPLRGLTPPGYGLRFRRNIE